MFMIAVLILLAGVGVAIYEVPRLLKQRMRRELIAFGILLFTGVALSVALVLDLPVPNPTRVVEVVFGPLSRLIYPR